MEERLYHDPWVVLLAEQMVTDVTDIMVGIPLKPYHTNVEELRKTRLAGVYGMVDCDKEICLSFMAEPSFFVRLAERMRGEALDDSQESREEIREYATEYVNTVYGRFLAELFRASHQRLGGYTLRYEEELDLGRLTNGKQVSFISLCSEKSETVIFSWAS